MNIQTTSGHRGMLGTGMPAWLLLGVVVLGLPRTILADLGVVAPESSLLYYVLALGPFAVWFAVAVTYRTPTPVRDHLVLGALYGLSLVIVHEALWNVGSASVGYHPPPGAAELAERFSSPLRELVPHAYSFAIAMTIGLGVGVIAAVVAAVAKRVRDLRTR